MAFVNPQLKPQFNIIFNGLPGLLPPSNLIIHFIPCGARHFFLSRWIQKAMEMLLLVSKCGVNFLEVDLGPQRLAVGVWLVIIEKR